MTVSFAPAMIANAGGFGQRQKWATVEGLADKLKNIDAVARERAGEPWPAVARAVESGRAG